jgi:hypothetical protein
MIYLSCSLRDEELLEAIYNVIEHEDEVPRKRQRASRVSRGLSLWGEMLASPDLQIEGSFCNKQFRRRFRVPFRLFQEVLVPMCKEANIFHMRYDSKVPLELKLMACLRILGRDSKADDISELLAKLENLL